MKICTYGFCWSSLFISMDGSKYSVGSGSTAPLTSLIWPEEENACQPFVVTLNIRVLTSLIWPEESTCYVFG